LPQRISETWELSGQYTDINVIYLSGFQLALQKVVQHFAPNYNAIGGVRKCGGGQKEKEEKLLRHLLWHEQKKT